jgi:hypothetical protein
MRRNIFIIISLFLLCRIGWAEDFIPAIYPAGENEIFIPPAQCRYYGQIGAWWIIGVPAGISSVPDEALLLPYHPELGDLFALSLQTPSEAEKIPHEVPILFNDGHIIILQAEADQLCSFPALRAEWLKITLTPKTPPVVSSAGAATFGSDDFSPYVTDIVAQVSETTYTENLQTLQDFVTRNTFTSNCDQAADWILSRFQSYGLNAYFDSFTISGQTKRNVIGEKIGMVYPDSILFITAHYDATVGQPYSPEPFAPGADDNGSGTACVLECARILSLYNFEKTIRFVAFAGEEQGLIGSFDYVQNLVNQQAHVVGSFNYDMISFSGSGNPPFGLSILTDNNPTSQAMGAKIAEAAVTFTPGALTPNLILAPGSASSDHYPFWQAGWAATFSIQGASYPYYHTIYDLIEYNNMAFAADVTRAAVAALADFAVPLGGGTEVGGEVFGRWEIAGSPYRVHGDLVVPQDSTLQIDPGVLVLFEGHYQFRILENGRLEAVGTVDEPIQFFALQPDSGWGGIRFLQASDSSRLAFCHLRYGLASGGGQADLGGAVYCSGTDLTLEHCILSSSRAQQGGAVACVDQAHARIIQCTITANTADLGGGLYCDDSNPLLSNCILWNNSPDQIHLSGSAAPAVSYCDIEGGWPGAGNINADPLFVASNLNNFHLQSTVGSYAYGFWLQGSADSPCIDAGDPAADYSQEPEPNGDRVNLGAYGNTPQASLSLHDPHYAFAEISGTWTMQNSPMNVIGDIYVPEGESLRIEPGVQVLFQGPYKLTVMRHASLIAEGTLEDSIIFTAVQPETGWQGLHFHAASDASSLSFCSLMYGKANGNGEDANGGAVYCDSTDLRLSHCRIESCSATSGGGFYAENSSPMITGNAFQNNTAVSGGAVYMHQSDPLISGNEFGGNSATNGGAATFWFSGGILRNNVLADNSANGFGGGAYCFNSNPEFVNNTVIANSGNIGGGLYSIGAQQPVIRNSIFRDNTPNPIAVGGSSAPEITYSDIQGGWTGEGNLDVDPIFDPGLFSAYQLSQNSPCVDAGDPSAQDQDPPDPQNPGYALYPALGTVRNDMGAFGGAGSASWVGIAEKRSAPAPEAFHLYQNSPNPFNAQTWIRYALTKPAFVKLAVYDLQGREAAALVKSWKNAGDHRTRLDGTKLASGIYFIRLDVGEEHAARKIVLLK